MPIFLVEGVRDALQEVRGPVILISNLLTEGSGMNGFTAGRCGAPDQPRPSAGRSTSSSTTPTVPSAEVLARYAAEDKRPLELGNLPKDMRVDRRRLLAG